MEKRHRRAASEISLRKYSFPNAKPLTSKHFKRDELVVPFKAFAKNEAQDKYKQKLSIKCHEKYKVKRTDHHKSLHVEYPPDDVKALTDIDDGFYHCVNGCTIPDHVPLFKSLQFALSGLLRMKKDIGIRNDAILRIELNRRDELNMFNISLQIFIVQATYFDSFISEDYQKSMDYLDKWEELKSKVQTKLIELQNVATEQFTTISRLMGLDYQYSKQQKYGRFLYYLSPPRWRSKNREFALSTEIAEKGFDLGYSSEEETFNVIFEKMQKECIGNMVKPVLYFTNPRDLLDIFDGIEKQQLHHFAYVNHWTPRKKMLNKGISYIKEIINQETSVVANIIQELETLLEFSENRCVQLKTKFFSILNGLFYKSVGAPEVLKLLVHLEFCYGRVYGEKPINLDIVALGKALEDFYMDYSMRLDALHCSTISTILTQCKETERRKLRKARWAARELRLFDRLERDLLRDSKPQPFLPPIKEAKPRKYTKREYIKHDTKVEAQKPLDESEIEYLSLFTDWTEGDDPAKYLHRLEDEQ